MITDFRIALIAGLLALIPIAALAESAQDKAAEEERGRAACTQDAQVYCSQYFPNRDEVGHCLKRNSKRISVDCRVLIRHFKD